MKLKRELAALVGQVCVGHLYHTFGALDHRTLALVEFVEIMLA